MRQKILAILFSSFVIILITSVIVYSLPNGIVGRTKKNSTVGCSCHTLNTAITGTFSGPDTVNIGQTVTYNFTITRTGSGAKGGINIATRLGTLAVGGGASYLRIQNGELTQQNPLTLTNGSFTGQFSYTAPATAGVDTLWLSEAIGYSNGWNWGTDKRVIIRNPVGINGTSTIIGYSLKQNYPNPFNPVTTIKFELGKSSFVSLTIFNIEGKAVEVLLNKNMQQGTHEISWDASGFGSGVYFYKITAGEFADQKKMILLK